MPDPISALSSFGAFKRINFEIVYANGGSFIGTVGIFGSLTGHTTISACTAALMYLDITALDAIGSDVGQQPSTIGHCYWNHTDDS